MGISAMEAHYRVFFVISILFHLIVIILIVKFFAVNNLDFEYREREVKVTVIKNKAVRKNLIKKIQQSRSVTNPETQDVAVVEDGISRSYRVDEEVEIPEVEKDYKSSSNRTDAKQITHKKVTGFDEEDFDLDIERELESLDSSPIQFENGEYRKILVDLDAEFKRMDFLASTSCRVTIVIDQTGEVIQAEILESTGELENDNKIVALVKKWKFEQSSLTRQTATVEMKYFFR